VVGGPATTYIPLGTHVADRSFDLDELLERLSLTAEVDGLLADLANDDRAAVAAASDTVTRLSRELAEAIRGEVEATQPLDRVRLHLHLPTTRYAQVGTPFAQGIANELRQRVHLSVVPLPGEVDICPASS
jgi:hypothetical protein